jgi:hypothetical protein
MDSPQIKKRYSNRATKAEKQAASAARRMLFLASAGKRNLHCLSFFHPTVLIKWP